MSTPRISWGTAGAIAGLAGLAVSHAATMALTLRSSPVVAVSETIIQLTPGPVAERAIDILGSRDKPVLVAVVVAVFLGIAIWAGLLAKRSWWLPLVVYAVMGGIAAAAVVTRYDARALDMVPVMAGVVTWIVALSFLTDPLVREQHEQEQPEVEAPRHNRRSFLIRAGAGGLVAIAVGLTGEVFGRGRRQVEKTRRLLRLAVNDPGLPPGVSVALEGVKPWRTSNNDFYQVHTAIFVPAIEPMDWRLRIHGMVREEMTLTYQDLLDLEITEAWITLNCVSNEVGGPLIGNAWWSGVRLAPLLAAVGVDPEADAVLQTSSDGWTCGTPLSVLTDDRNAMLAIAMNGEPLPIEHGFPVRTLVPGLYGYVSACKWVVDMEVSRFDRFDAFWTERDWAEQAPVKLASRIDVPEDGGDVEVGDVRIAGSAWAQRRGIAEVEYSLDGGAWKGAALARVPSADTWVQWTATVDVDEGDHELRVRAIAADGEVQTGVERDVLPDGATGWHTIEFSAS